MLAMAALLQASTALSATRRETMSPNCTLKSLFQCRVSFLHTLTLGLKNHFLAKGLHFFKVICELDYQSLIMSALGFELTWLQSHSYSRMLYDILQIRTVKS